MTTPVAKPERENAHGSFLLYAHLRWAKLAFLLGLLSVLAYAAHQPQDGPNGGTWLGYTLGTVGALLIVWLTWLGVRKRRYGSRVGTVKGWTSAHVYLGLSLIIIATLHCGFQFGWNVHTLAYALMMLVIGSGIWGIAVYARLPEQITRLREGSTREAWIDEVFDLNEQAIKLADKLGPEIHRKTVASAEKMRIGGSLLQQLRGPVDHSSTQAALRDSLKERATQLRAKTSSLFDPNATAQNTVMFMAGQIAATDKGEKEAMRIQQLLDLIARRNALVTRINRDIALHARLQLWLLFHVPLTFALLAALTAHIVSVFFYW